ncbi:MAG: PqqD family protein [Ruminococcaceae bacterium]|nr:PqqD family protein [Oscillospiraceae bacterium]
MENKKYGVKQGYIVREIAGEFIAVPVDSSCGTNIVVLNPVSRFLWDLMKTEKTFDELLDAMLSNYDVSKEEAETDLKDFLKQLTESGLLN